EKGRAVWKSGPEKSKDLKIITELANPFAHISGIKVLSGNLGRAIMKISALVDGEDTLVEAPAMVFHSQQEVEQAFEAGQLNRDLVAVVRFQGPRANGMPELHKLITWLSIAMDQGNKVGLVTDGRLSGASGKVPFAIHCTPEALVGGLLGKVEEGDIIRMDARNNLLELKVPKEVLAERASAEPLSDGKHCMPGHQIFVPLRRVLSGAEEGASALNFFSMPNHISKRDKK
ncbi:MAG: phosphogluconate dehydratase, partial [Candidatus Electrothrix sp. AR4]|nr:phosphogluconate dehydratase [Candidatus Electrothrix sp. AR4]